MTYRWMGALMMTAAAAVLTHGWIRDGRRTIQLAEALAAALERMAGRIRWQNLPLSRVLCEERHSDICGIYFADMCDSMVREQPLHILWYQAFREISDRKTQDILCRVDLRGDGEQVIGSLHLASEELRHYAAALAARQQQNDRLLVAVSGSVTAILIIILI